MAIASLLRAHTARAQEIRGVVRDSAVGIPLSGAIVQLLDDSRHAVARTLSDERGQYRLQVMPGAEWLQVLRIGYRPRTRSLPRDIAGAPSLDIDMARLPQRLEPIRVVQNAQCPIRSDAGQAFALWEEARAGLLAMVVAREARPAAMRLIGFTRAMRLRGDQGIDHQLVRLQDTAAAKQSFEAVLGAREFGDQGFMSEDSTGRRAYFGPDPDVLLDPAFLASYCFSIADADREHPGQTGLSFEPAPGGGRDTLVEVRGTLWLDRSAAALRTLEFRYLNLEPATDRVMPGGKESFLSLANGTTLIDHWEIRFPIVGGAVVSGVSTVMLFRESRQLHIYRRGNTGAWVGALYVSGGQLVSAVWPDGFTWHAKLPSVTGTVVDTAGAPLAGVTVVGDSTDYSAVSDSSGAFTIHDVLAGPYQWYATVPQLRVLGVRTSPFAPVEVDSGETAVRVTARVGPAARDYFCTIGPPAFDRPAPTARQPDSSIALVGRLLNADQTPATDVDLRVKWVSRPSNAILSPGQERGPVGFGKDILQLKPGDNVMLANHIDVKPNASGRFRVCGAPPAGARLYAFRGDRQLLDERLTMTPGDWIQGAVLTLPSTTKDASPKRSSDAAMDSDFIADLSSVEGTMHDTTGYPLQEVMVTIKSKDGPTIFADDQGRFRFDTLLTTLTDNAGQFRFQRLLPGTYLLTAKRRGLEARTVTVDVPPAYKMQLSVPMHGAGEKPRGPP